MPISVSLLGIWDEFATSFKPTVPSFLDARESGPRKATTQPDHVAVNAAGVELH
jgi:hypothetical protein